MTIREFAQKAADAGNSKVIFTNPSDVELKGYSKVERAVLDSSLLRTLGWNPYSGDSAIEETVKILREI